MDAMMQSVLLTVFKHTHTHTHHCQFQMLSLWPLSQEHVLGQIQTENHI